MSASSPPAAQPPSGGAASTPTVQPISQGSTPPKNTQRRGLGWVWWEERPRRTFPADPDASFKLVPTDLLDELCQTFALDETAIARIKLDLDHLDKELLRYFREVDHAAKRFQNGFRLYNVRVLLLATTATLFGTFQAISLSFSPALLLVLGAAETIVALYTVYVVNTRTQEASLDAWLKNRRQSEQLRREFFRYLLYLPPYYEDDLEWERKRKLSQRAAAIYADQFPEEPSILETGDPAPPGVAPVASGSTSSPFSAAGGL